MLVSVVSRLFSLIGGSILPSPSLVDVGAPLNYFREKVPLVSRIVGGEPGAFYDSRRLVEAQGYPFEEHNVTTSDGYVLTLHRIPHSRLNSTRSTRVVLFMHGLITASDIWLMTNRSYDAPYFFSDAGFDVFLGNLRGTTYSRYITDELRDRYWDFTWDHHAKYDLPATIRKTLEVSGATQLHYIAHSEGTLVMFARLSEDPELSKLIRSNFALGPIGGVRFLGGGWNTVKRIFEFSTDVGELTRKASAVLRNVELFGPAQTMLKIPLAGGCGEGLLAQMGGNLFCSMLLYGATGPDTGQVDERQLAVQFMHTPTSMSAMNLLHFVQMAASQDDYVRHFNQYNCPDDCHPAVYNFSRISVPTYLYYGDMDILSTYEDIEANLVRHIPSQYLRGCTKASGFNHVDFLMGRGARKRIYAPILREILKIEREEDSSKQ